MVLVFLLHAKGKSQLFKLLGIDHIKRKELSIFGLFFLAYESCFYVRKKLCIQNNISLVDIIMQPSLISQTVLYLILVRLSVINDCL